MAITSRAAACAALILPSSTTTARPSNVSLNQRAQQRPPRKATAAVARASGGGAVLDRPAFDQSLLDTIPAAQEGALPRSLYTISYRFAMHFSLPICDLLILICAMYARRRRHGKAQGPEGHWQR
jgi:hypothetical protein